MLPCRGRRSFRVQRISSKKETTSQQLGEQVSLKWTTGTGPRIVWAQLHLRALEQRYLSPRRASSPTGRGRRSTVQF
jgi:hypothetical protein